MVHLNIYLLFLKEKVLEGRMLMNKRLLIKAHCQFYIVLHDQLLTSTRTDFNINLFKIDLKIFKGFLS